MVLWIIIILVIEVHYLTKRLQCPHKGYSFQRKNISLRDDNTKGLLLVVKIRWLILFFIKMNNFLI